MLLAFTLLCRVWLTASLILTNILLAIFLGAVLSAAWRGLDVACGCLAQPTACLRTCGVTSAATPFFCWLVCSPDLAARATTTLHLDPKQTMPLTLC